MTESFIIRLRAWLQILPRHLRASRFWARPVFWAALFTMVFTVIMIVWNPSTRIPELPIGSVASTTIRAPYDIRLEDQITTEARKKEAMNRVPPVYAWDPLAHEALVEKLKLMFQTGRNLLTQIEQPESRLQKPANKKKETRNKPPSIDLTSSLFPENMPESVRKWLIANRFEPKLENRLTRTIMDIYRNYIAVDPANIKTNPSQKLMTVNTRSGLEKVQRREDVRIISLQDARQMLSERLELFVDSARVRKDMVRWLGDLLVPNFWPIPEETKRRREYAAALVQPLQIYIKKGQPIIRAGQIVNETTAMILAAYRKRQSRWQTFRWITGVTLIVCIIIGSLYFVMEHLPVENILLMKKPLFAVSLSLWVPQIFILKILNHFIVPALVIAGLPESWEGPLFFAMPFALGAMIWSFLGDRTRGGWFALLSAPVMALMLNVDFWGFLYIFGFGLLAVLLSRNYRFRFTIFTAGLTIGLANTLWAFIIHLARFEVIGMGVTARDLFAAFLAGPVTATLVTIMIPLVENVFDILTDIKLLELSNLNAPLLRQLALQAPGTYFHSIGVGQLAEAAAEAIGANALFVKVAALYHDIGKLSRPEYYVENQKGENPHDRLSPNVSRLIIFSHIKEGIALARKYNLPSTIIDMIPQHHGTKPLSYFYGKARAMARQQENGDPDENAYRYSGPKPQTREAAILMLADGIEAASRSLREPNPRKLTNVVDNIIRFCLEDGQLDESNLTLAELRQIRDAMIQTLNLMFHQRVSYPGFDFGEGEERFEFDQTHERVRNLPPDSDEPVQIEAETDRSDISSK